MFVVLGREPPVGGQDGTDSVAQAIQDEFADALDKCYGLLTTDNHQNTPHRSPQDQSWIAARVVDFDLWTASTGAFARDKNGLCQKLSTMPETIGVFTTLLRSLSAVWRRHEGLGRRSCSLHTFCLSTDICQSTQALHRSCQVIPNPKITAVKTRPLRGSW